MELLIFYVGISCTLFIIDKTALEEGLNIIRYLIWFSLIVSLISSGIYFKTLIDIKENKSWDTIWEEYCKIE